MINVTLQTIKEVTTYNLTDGYQLYNYSIATLPNEIILKNNSNDHTYIIVDQQTKIKNFAIFDQNQSYIGFIRQKDANIPGTLYANIYDKSYIIIDNEETFRIYKDNTTNEIGYVTNNTGKSKYNIIKGGIYSQCDHNIVILVCGLVIKPYADNVSNV